MLSSLSSKSGHSEPISEINVTPLVDVMLVLLVIFILTAPLLAQAISVNLPQTVKVPSANPAATYLTLYADGRYELDQIAVDATGLAITLSDKLITEPNLVLRLESDASVPYEDVAQLLAIAKQVGIKRLSMATEAR
ncbi:MAG: biopolymer transporter ExbD [Thiotrichaceae bacterium]|nr:biopolymer transporter ExbD [Thiotrichaceae bacterium]